LNTIRAAKTNQAFLFMHASFRMFRRVYFPGIPHIHKVYHETFHFQGMEACFRTSFARIVHPGFCIV
jgi:hypothetical protein